jgi:hypothetical protein
MDSGARDQGIQTMPAGLDHAGRLFNLNPVGYITLVVVKTSFAVSTGVGHIGLFPAGKSENPMANGDQPLRDCPADART